MDPVYIILIAIAVVAISIFLAVKAAKGGLGGGEAAFENIVLAIRVPKENEKDALAAEQMFSSLHGLLKLSPEVQEHLSFEIASESDKGVKFYTVVPTSFRDFVEGQIYAQYPNAEIREAEDYVDPEALASLSVEGTSVELSREYILPIKTFPDFEVDPLSAITSAISKLGPQEKVWLQILIRPVPDTWQEAGHEYVERVRMGYEEVKFIEPVELFKNIGKEVATVFLQAPKKAFNPTGPDVVEKGKPEEPSPVRLSAGKELELKMIENKLTRMGFETAIRVLAAAPTEEVARAKVNSVVASLKQFSTANLNSFVHGAPMKGAEAFIEAFKHRTFPGEGGFVLNTEELASIFHLPSVSVETPAIAWSEYKRGESPLNLPLENCTYLGKTTYRDSMVKFGIKNGEDRAKHMYAVGKTGTGKSTLFRNMIVQDMINGYGVGVLDPHGELIDQLLEMVPDHRVDDVVIFDPSDFKHPTAINMLECPNPAQKNLMASGLVEVFKRHFEYSWGPRLEYLLNNSILTLLDVPNTTLLGITRLLSDMNYQRYIVYKVKDLVIKNFWEEEYKEMRGNQRLITEAIAPIQNKVGRFLASSTIRNIVGQARSTINLNEIMDEGKILFVNLAKGKIGEDNSNLLGSMLISRLQFMAMQRINVPEEQRQPFYMYVDEFQNFASGAFASILSEARKFKLCLHLTHQYTAQLPEEMLDAVFGNIGTICSFALGAPDAAVLAPEFAPVFDENDLISLERYNMYVKLMIDGMTSPPFSAISLPPPEMDKANLTGNKGRIVALSREKYGTDAAVVEKRIDDWVQREFNLGMAIAEGKRSESPKSEFRIQNSEGEVVEGRLDGEGSEAGDPASAEASAGKSKLEAGKDAGSSRLDGEGYRAIKQSSDQEEKKEIERSRDQEVGKVEELGTEKPKDEKTKEHITGFVDDRPSTPSRQEGEVRGLKGEIVL